MGLQAPDPPGLRGPLAHTGQALVVRRSSAFGAQRPSGRRPSEGKRALIRRLRRRHFATFLVLGALLVVLFIASLVARQPAEDYLGELVRTGQPTTSQPGD